MTGRIEAESPVRCCLPEVSGDLIDQLDADAEQNFRPPAGIQCSSAARDRRDLGSEQAKRIRRGPSVFGSPEEGLARVDAQSGRC